MSARAALERAVEAVRRACPNAIGTPLDLRAIAESVATEGETTTDADAVTRVTRAWTRATRDPGNALTEGELASVMRAFHTVWMEHGRSGTPLDDGTWAFRCARVNRPAVKQCLTRLATWTRRGAWAGWVEACREMRREVAMKSGGRYETYAQVVRGLSLIHI